MESLCEISDMFNCRAAQRLRADNVRRKWGLTDMISRLWRGWTAPQDADTYEDLLRAEIFPAILARNIEGFRRIELYRASADQECEFVTVMWFDSLESIKAFAGPDYETAVVPPKARAVLKRFDERSRHYEVRAQREVH
jgi:heme-degrading monooxygenase HmoA